jgi:DNA-binding protein HU-beta
VVNPANVVSAEKPTGYSRTMTKSQFVDALAQTTGQTKQESERSLEAVLETLTTALKRGERIDWRGFGVFKVRDAKARQARNPRTGEMVSVPAKKVATFKPGKEFAASLNPDGATPAE